MFKYRQDMVGWNRFFRTLRFRSNSEFIKSCICLWKAAKSVCKDERLELFCSRDCDDDSRREIASQLFFSVSCKLLNKLETPCLMVNICRLFR